MARDSQATLETHLSTKTKQSCRTCRK